MPKTSPGKIFTKNYYTHTFDENMLNANEPIFIVGMHNFGT